MRILFLLLLMPHALCGMQGVWQRISDYFSGRIIARNAIREGGLDIPMEQGLIGRSQRAQQLLFALARDTMQHFEHAEVGSVFAQFNEQGDCFIADTGADARTVLAHVADDRKLSFSESISDQVPISARFSRKGKYAVLLDKNNTITVCNVSSTKRCTASVQERIHSYLFDEDEEHCAFSHGRGMLRIWNIDSGKIKTCILSCAKAVKNIQYFAQGVLIFIDEAGTVYLFDVHSKDQRVYTFDFSRQAPLTALCNKRGDALIVTCADNSAYVVDISTGSDQLRLKHTGVKRAFFCCDDAYIITVSDSNTLRFWDARTKKEVGSFSCRELLYHAFLAEDDILVASFPKLEPAFSVGGYRYYERRNASIRMFFGPLSEIIKGASLDEYELLEAFDVAIQDSQKLRAKGIRNKRARIHPTQAQWRTWRDLCCGYRMPILLKRVLERYISPVATQS